MYKKLFLFLFALVANMASAQTISGQVKNAENLPVEFAAVRLYRTQDSSVAQGIYTSEDGSFLLNKLKPGNYYLKITFSGLEPLNRSGIQLVKGKNLELGVLTMQPDSDIVKEMDDIVVKGSLDVLKAGIDKKVYSVQEDISTRGGTVNDVLNNIPSIDIDQEGTISLRGDQNVTVLIDGRPSGLVLGDGQNLLDALPANSIERVEVVTNPSAKYDPDGTSGIINIVLKKNKLRGFNGMVSVTAGTGNQYEANAAFSYRNPKINSYFNYSFNYYEGFRNFSSELYRDVLADSTTALIQQRQGTDRRSGNTISVGTDFYLKDRHTLGVSVTGSMGDRLRTGDLQNRLFNGDDLLVDRWDRISEDPRARKNLDANLNYTWKFKEDMGEWSTSLNQSYGEGSVQGFYEELYYDNQEVLNGLSPLNQRLDNKNSNKITTAQTDYSYIFEKIRARMEGGAKVILQEQLNNTYSETMDTLSGNYFEDTLANFDYKYSGSVYSLYGIFGQELGKFKYQVGVRAEFAVQHPQLLSTGENFRTTYQNLFPSSHLKYEVGENQELSLSYSRRINRPRSRQLNPFTSYADPFNLRSGNPQLTPEYIHSIDFGYSLNYKKVILTTSVYHRRTTDVINRVKYYFENNTAIVTYDNIDKSESTGTEVVLIYKPVKWWKNTISFNGNYIDYTNLDPNTDWNNDGFNWNVKYIGALDFWDRTASFQLNASYVAPRVSPQGIVQPRTGIDLSLEKRLLNKQLSVGVRVRDVFNTRGFELDLEQEGVRQLAEYKWLTRRVLFNVSYKFGKFDQRKLPRNNSEGGGFD